MTIGVQGRSKQLDQVIAIFFGIDFEVLHIMYVILYIQRKCCIYVWELHDMVPHAT